MNNIKAVIFFLPALFTGYNFDSTLNPVPLQTLIGAAGVNVSRFNQTATTSTPINQSGIHTRNSSIVNNQMQLKHSSSGASF